MNAQQSPKTTAFIWLIARLYLGSTWFGSGFEKVFGDGNAGVDGRRRPQGGDWSP